MTKVLFLTTGLARDNGWSRYSREIIQRLPQFGIHPVVLVDRSAPSCDLDIEVHHCLRSHGDRPTKAVNIAADWARCRKLLRDCNAVHCLAERYLITAHTLSRTTKVPLITTAVGTHTLSVLRSRWSWFYHRAYHASRVILSISSYTGKRLADQLPEVADKIQRVPLGVEVTHSAYKFPPAEEREHAFLMVGQVKPRKGTLQAVEALAGLVSRFPEVHLYIAGTIGDQGYAQHVSRRVKELRLNKHVSWLGKVAEAQLLDYYSRVRGLVMPSMNAGASFEGFGLVHLEANALGVPTIGSLDCGNEDAVASGSSGFLLKQNDISAITNAMAALLNSDRRWDELSRSAFAFAQSRDWQDVARQYAAVYD